MHRRTFCHVTFRGVDESAGDQSVVKVGRCENRAGLEIGPTAQTHHDRGVGH